MSMLAAAGNFILNDIITLRYVQLSTVVDRIRVDIFKSRRPFRSCTCFVTNFWLHAALASRTPDHSKLVKLKAANRPKRGDRQILA